MNNAQSIVNTSLNLITNQSERAALKLDGAQEQINQAKERVDVKINEINNATNTINSIYETMVRGMKQVQTKIKNKLEETNVNKIKRDEIKSINDVRSAQIKELKEKHSGNYHSSWLGLWRPLTSESQTGLFIASIVLGVIAILSIIYLMVDPALKMSPASTNPLGFPHIGGLHEKLVKKNK